MSASFLFQLAELGDHAEQADRAECASLDNIAGEFHDLLVAHCPLCNGFGPQCIVETVQSALSADDDGESAVPPLLAH